ncbi:MAG: hypothetical protein ACPGVK_05130 [Halocynthiibacter sp.]
MDVFSEMFKAFQARVTNHVFGSIVFVFLALNWQPVYYVLFADVSMLERFTYFNEETTALTRVLFPITFGILIGLAAPRIKLFFDKIVNAPIQEGKVLRENNAHDLEVLKITNEEDRKSKQADAAFQLAEKKQKISDVITDEVIKKEALGAIDVKSVDSVQEALELLSPQALKYFIRLKNDAVSRFDIYDLDEAVRSYLMEFKALGLFASSDERGIMIITEFGIRARNKVTEDMLDNA